MRKRLEVTYHLRWEEPDPNQVRTVTKECVKCSKTLTPENRSTFFLSSMKNPYNLFPSIGHRRKLVSPFAHYKKCLQKGESDNHETKRRGTKVRSLLVDCMQRLFQVQKEIFI